TRESVTLDDGHSEVLICEFATSLYTDRQGARVPIEGDRPRSDVVRSDDLQVGHEARRGRLACVPVQEACAHAEFAQPATAGPPDLIVNALKPRVPAR